MFRAQQNAFDDAVGEPLPSQPQPRIGQLTHLRAAKATDENLTSENWEYILVRWRVGEGSGGGFLLSAYGLCRMFATRSKAAIQGMDNGAAFDAVCRWVAKE